MADKAQNHTYMLLHIKMIHLKQLYAFAYNSLYLFKINAKAYNHDDISRVRKNKKK